MSAIENQAKTLIELADRAIAWSDKYVDDISRKAVSNSVKSVRRGAKKVAQAAAKRPAVAIFGQSQVGKSYLVQNLTKPDDAPYLEIRVAGEDKPLNFITDINPDGGKESTGTVTRFTTNMSLGTKEFPVSVELFSQLDVAAMLVNGYQSDLKEFPHLDLPDSEDLKELFTELKQATKADDNLDEDEVQLFVHYVRDLFRDSATIRALENTGFFRDLTIHLPFIPVEQRWRVLEFLWEKNDFINALFRVLTDGLKVLRYATAVHVQMEAITPNTSTILDVERVREIYTGKHDDLVVGLNSGQKVVISRSIFSALTKEVALCIANDFSSDPLRGFMQTTDVLDFPGSKSREKMPVNVFNSNSSDQKLHLFIRGKVSYIFDSYTNNFGVSTLLYCMDDNPPEEKEAPARLGKWVGQYVGVGHSERARRTKLLKELLASKGVSVDAVSPLMVVMTKFNQEINKVLFGQGGDLEKHDAKWNARLIENFAHFMTRPVEDKWVMNWEYEGQDFPFVFPIRDPLYSQATFDGFDAIGWETGIRPEREEALAVMGKSFVYSTSVRSHIPNPDFVWKELTSPNGTGISNLCKHLSPASDPIITETRLLDELSRLSSELRTTLAAHAFSGDLDQDLKEAERKSVMAWTSIQGLALRKDGILSKILTKMTVTEVEIWNLFYDFKFDSSESQTVGKSSVIDVGFVRQTLSNAGIQLTTGMTRTDVFQELRKFYEGMSDDEIRSLILEMFEVDIEFLTQESTASDTSRNRNEFTDLVLSYWNQRLIDVLSNDALISSISQMQRDALLSAVSEIAKGRTRFHLNDHLNKFAQSLAFGTVEDKDFNLIAACYCSVLNSYLYSAGWKYASEEEKPIISASGVRIFSEQASIPNRQTITGYSTTKTDRKFVDHWAWGVKRLYGENVRTEYGVKGDLNRVANDQLNEILSRVPQ